MFDMMKMLGKMKEVQGKMKEAQENLVNVKADGESGGGMVKVTVNGKKQVISIQIEDEIFSKNDKDLLQDLVVAAVNKALEEVDGLAKAELKKTTEGILPEIPGLDLNNLM